MEYSSLNDPSFSPLDWHDYRLVIEPDSNEGNAITAKLFLDGDFGTPILTQFLQTSFFDEIRMGDATTFNNGVMDIDYLRFALLDSVVDGDFNTDGLWNCQDINALTAAIATSSGDLSFDMNGDGVITLADVTDAVSGWLTAGGANNPGDTGGNAFLIGDANLDGTVDGQDFLEWNGSKFTMTSAWCQGDFNADGTVDGQDFLEWNTHKFTRSDALSAVPEPLIGWMGMAISVSVFGVTRRRHVD